jgi:GNAT superfamily N-acetyltransferase
MGINLRNFLPQDRPILAELLSRVPAFDLEDQAIALELIDLALHQPQQTDYYFRVAADEKNRLVGYACYGPTPLTEGTFDLYWIAVEPVITGQGIGTLLLQAVEEEIRKNNGRLILIETSSNSIYELTRKFYLKNGYILAETIHDFYREGEDRHTYIKRILPSGSISTFSAV